MTSPLCSHFLGTEEILHKNTAKRAVTVRFMSTVSSTHELMKHDSKSEKRMCKMPTNMCKIYEQSCYHDTQVGKQNVTRQFSMQSNSCFAWVCSWANNNMASWSYLQMLNMCSLQAFSLHPGGLLVYSSCDLSVFEVLYSISAIVTCASKSTYSSGWQNVHEFYQPNVGWQFTINNWS